MELSDSKHIFILASWHPFTILISILVVGVSVAAISYNENSEQVTLTRTLLTDFVGLWYNNS